MKLYLYVRKQLWSKSDRKRLCNPMSMLLGGQHTGRHHLRLIQMTFKPARFASSANASSSEGPIVCNSHTKSATCSSIRPKRGGRKEAGQDGVARELPELPECVNATLIGSKVRKACPPQDCGCKRERRLTATEE